MTAETAPGAAGLRPAHVRPAAGAGFGVFPLPCGLGSDGAFPPRGSWAGAVNAASPAYISGAGLLALPRPGHTGSPLLKPLRRRRGAGKAAPSINGSSVCRRGGDGATGSADARPAHGELGGGGGHGLVGPGKGAGCLPRGCQDTQNLSVPGASPPDGFRSASPGLCHGIPLPLSITHGGTPHCTARIPLPEPWPSPPPPLCQPPRQHLGIFSPFRAACCSANWAGLLFSEQLQAKGPVPHSSPCCTAAGSPQGPRSPQHMAPLRPS